MGLLFNQKIMEGTIQILNGIIELYYLSKHPDPLNSQLEGDLPQQLYEKTQLLKRNLDASIFESNASHENIIRYQQEAFHHLVNSLELENDLEPWKTEIFRSAINEIFTHLLTYFYVYINSEKSLPYFFSRSFIELRLKSIDLQLSKLDRSGIKNTLIDSLRDYLTTFKNHKYISLNYRQLVYLQEMLLVLSSTDFNKADIEKLLSNQLLKLNFNHLLFFRYLQCRIQEKIDAFDSLEKKMEYLRLEAIAIPNYKNEDSCYKEWPSIQELLAGWIKGEQDVISKSNTQCQSNQSGDEEKIQLDISVAQLACIVKCFYEETAHYSVTVKSMLRLISQKIATKRQSEISYKSLSKSYYAVEQTTAASVLSLLEKIIFRIKKSYFS